LPSVFSHTKIDTVKAHTGQSCDNRRYEYIFIILSEICPVGNKYVAKCDETTTNHALA